jgi:hypothetical protein
MAVVVLLFVTFTIPSPHAQDNRTQAEATLRQLEQDMTAAADRGDWRLWDQLVAPDWIFIDPFGRIQDKPAVLAVLKQWKVPLESSRIYGVQVKFLKDDVAVVIAQESTVGKLPQRKVKVRFSFMDVFVQRQGKWVVVASGGTPVKESAQ